MGMRIIRFNESLDKKYKKYNDLLKNLGVMDDRGNIGLKDMMEKINGFLSKAGNKDEFLKEFDDDLKEDIKVKNTKIKAKHLSPSQNAIFLDHVLSRLVVNDYDREQILNGELKDHDILISEDDHVIDGHHRWAACMVLNPDCEIDCTEIKLPIEYALPIINAMLEVNAKITLGRTGDYSVNIFDLNDWTKKKLKKKVKSIITKTIRGGVDLGDDKNLKSEEAWKDDSKDNRLSKPFFKNIKRHLKLKKGALKFMTKNIKKISDPDEQFSSREEMPHIKGKQAKSML
jgi:hypothetical protein